MVRQRDIVRLPLHGTCALDVIGKIRKANAALALALLAFFYAHALMGSFAEEPVGSVALVLIWLFMTVAVVHLVLCVMTSRAMLEDEVRPPSRKKKAHLALKWASGIVLLAAAAIHCQVLNGAGALFASLLVAALAWHAWVGAKSAVRDLRGTKMLVAPLRLAVCCIAALLVFSLLASGWQ